MRRFLAGDQPERDRVYSAAFSVDANRQLDRGRVRMEREEYLGVPFATTGGARLLHELEATRVLAHRVDSGVSTLAQPSVAPIGRAARS
jgi:hypothetical protein